MLLKPDALSIAREQLSFVNGWKMDFTQQPDHLMVVYERTKRPGTTI